MIARADRAGLGIAIAGHALLFGALSFGWLARPKALVEPVVPVNVQLIGEIGVKDTAPEVSSTPPAPSAGPEVAPPVETSPPVVTPPHQSTPSPAPLRPIAKSPLIARPQPTATKPEPPSSAPHPLRGSRLGRDFLSGISDRPSVASGHLPNATLGPVVEASLAREVLRQLKPHWHAPTGADAEQLRTELSISLARDGSVRDVHVIRTTGQSDGNRGQVSLHQEAAIKAVRLAAPFNLPSDLYDAWKLLEPVSFDRRLGQ